LKQCEDLFIKFGGHKAAAGLSMKKENFGPFKVRMNDLLKNIPVTLRTKIRTFDVEVGIEEISDTLLKDLEKLEPFGPGNERPVFRMKNAMIQNYRIMKDAHVKWTFGSANSKVSVQGISFNYIGKWNELTPDELFELQKKSGLTIQFTLGVNRFNGNESIQLMVDKVLAGHVN
jgi:single-stranded-DNA-specific exonuclease